MSISDEITSLIPHRPPFLWVDKIVFFSEDTIVTEKLIPADLDIFDGHYPGNPIMPGVLLCEAIFQSGALLMGKMEQSPDSTSNSVPVLTRINGAKFKRSVYPGDSVQIKVRLTESISSVSFFKGSMKLNGKVAVQVDFACAMVASE
jgi:3-hydroxyacyl-[acyl-carrier-protein] dehydratase